MTDRQAKVARIAEYVAKDIAAKKTANRPPRTYGGIEDFADAVKHSDSLAPLDAPLRDTVAYVGGVKITVPNCSECELAEWDDYCRSGGPQRQLRLENCVFLAWVIGFACGCVLTSHFWR